MTPPPPGWWVDLATGETRPATKAELAEANRLLAQHHDIAGPPWLRSYADDPFAAAPDDEDDEPPQDQLTIEGAKP